MKKQQSAFYTYFILLIKYFILYMPAALCAVLPPAEDGLHPPLPALLQRPHEPRNQQT